MEKVKKAPAIRFRAYNRDWKQLSLDQHASFLKGKGYKKEDLKSSGQEIILYGKMYTDYKTAYTKSDTFVNLQQGSVLSQAGDVIVPASGETAEEISIASAILKDNIILGGDINIIRPTGDLDPIFLALSISTGSVKNELTKMAEGATIAHLRNNNLKKVTVVAPHLEEQTQIGNFFKNLDEKLELEKEKHEKLKIFKKAMLEDMFPKEGERVPKVRFKGFDDEWNVLQLKDLGQKYTSLTGKTKSDFGHGSGRYVTFSNVLANPVSTIDGVDKIEIDSSQNAVKFGDLFFNISSETYDEVGMSSVWTHSVEDYYLNSFCMGFRPSVKVNNYFITYLLRSRDVREQIMKLAQGISRINISQTKMIEIFLYIPSQEEQFQIGNFFKNLDEKITLSEKKIAKIENFKKAMLEKMFV
ncbi:restriction endonuclease subunit S [Negativicoccus succinicivorans]